MVSSFAIHYENRRTLDELLVIDPRERDGGPVAMQLFGQDPEVMRTAARAPGRGGADLIDLKMGCPRPEGLQDRRGRRAAQGPRHRQSPSRAPPPRAPACP